MTAHGYTLFDVILPAHAWKNMDDVVRYLEYIRLNINIITDEIPTEYRLFLISSGSAHNVGNNPMIAGKFAGLGLGNGWNHLKVLEKIDDWVTNNFDQVKNHSMGIVAPTWLELDKIGIYPYRAEV